MLVKVQVVCGVEVEVSDHKFCEVGGVDRKHVKSKEQCHDAKCYVMYCYILYLFIILYDNYF